METITITKKNILVMQKWMMAGAMLCAILIIVGIAFSGGKKQENVWYVERGLEDAWARILWKAEPPETFAQTRVWDGMEIPSGPGVLIATSPWQTEKKVTVYPHLSLEMEHRGATALALDPWMVFRKRANPPLTFDRAFSTAGGSGLLLIPGSDSAAVKAWASRFIQEEPGKFPDDAEAWLEWEAQLHNSYDRQWALFRLMGNEPAWLYAPLSAIRRYRDPRKSFLEAAPFPESGSQTSLQATILWALPTGSGKNKEKLAETIAWLKSPGAQTVIADTLEWIPADPFGEPYDTVSLSSQRAWLTAAWVYTINN